MVLVRLPEVRLLEDERHSEKAGPEIDGALLRRADDGDVVKALHLDLFHVHSWHGSSVERQRVSNEMRRGRAATSTLGVTSPPGHTACARTERIPRAAASAARRCSRARIAPPERAHLHNRRASAPAPQTSPARVAGTAPPRAYRCRRTVGCSERVRRRWPRPSRRPPPRRAIEGHPPPCPTPRPPSAAGRLRRAVHATSPAGRERESLRSRPLERRSAA